MTGQIAKNRTVQSKTVHLATLFFDSQPHTHPAVSLPCNQCVHLGAVGRIGMVQDNQSREQCRSWTVLRCLLGFLFHKAMQKHKIGEVGKQSII